MICGPAEPFHALLLRVNPAFCQPQFEREDFHFGSCGIPADAGPASVTTAMAATMASSTRRIMLLTSDTTDGHLGSLRLRPV